jgi:hypothetical protein
MIRRGATLAQRQGSSCRFAFPQGDGDQAGRLIFESARESGAQVRGFRPAQRRLEDIFMEALEQ